jgi:pSer/pThr/pTyr-binding forkhead associated (FHA) protein
VFYVINTEDMNKNGLLDKIKVGRSVDSDVRVTDDISVSRSHAFIKKGPNGDYYLEDNKSKFGTLMLV